MSHPRQWACGLAVLFLVGLTGCPSPNIYGTARTLPKGKIKHTIAAEGYGVSYTRIKKDTDSQGNTITEEKEKVGGFLPTLPTYALHYGATDELELGFRIANVSSLGADGKYNFLRSKSVDLAVDPGFQWFSITSGSSSGGESHSATIHVVYAHLPLLMDLNMSDSARIVLSPGIMYGIISGSDSGDIDSDDAFDGFWARLGVGLNLRASEGLAVQPEITFLKLLDSMSDTENVLMYSAGIGFNFGHFPDFNSSADVQGQKL